MNILIVDDDDALRVLTAAILAAAGFEVLMAIDGEQALERLTPEVDLVLLDLQLPKLSGADVLHQWTGRREVLGKVVVMSAATEEELTTIVGSSGARGYLQKPFNGADLLAAVA